VTSPRAKSHARLSWVEDFTSAYHSFRRLEAARIFDAHATENLPRDLLILGAQAHMREQPAVAIRILVGLFVRNETKQAVEKAMLLGEAYSRTNDFESADSHLGAAQAMANQIGDDEALFDIAWRRTLRFCLDGELTKARECLRIVWKGQSESARLHALQFESLILAAEGRSGEAAARCQELLRSISDSSRQLHHVAVGSVNLALFARELYLPDAVPELERHLAIGWPEDYAIFRFQVTKSLAWTKALQGDYFNAFRLLHRASDISPTNAWTVVSACDRSYLARCLGEARWSRQELDIAEQLAQEVDWNGAGEESFGLLLLSELFAPLDPTKSSMYLARFRQLGEVLRLPTQYKHDPRWPAYVQYSTAVTELALGDTRRGLIDLRAAKDKFERLGFEWRSARCMILEHRVTGNPELLRTAQERLRNYGQSWLADELRSLGRGDGIELPPQQQRVFEEMCQGKSTTQIAGALGRSEWTVSNHIKQIFKAYNVKSRAELLAEAGRRGLLNR
jgi:DNA-binding CsgD family transcriptional regulator